MPRIRYPVTELQPIRRRRFALFWLAAGFFAIGAAAYLVVADILRTW